MIKKKDYWRQAFLLKAISAYLCFIHNSKRNQKVKRTSTDKFKMNLKLGYYQE